MSECCVCCRLAFLFVCVFLVCVQSELTLSDLTSSLSGHGLALSKPSYYADSVFAGGMCHAHSAVQTAQVQLLTAANKEMTNAKEKKEGRKK